MQSCSFFDHKFVNKQISPGIKIVVLCVGDLVTAFQEVLEVGMKAKEGSHVLVLVPGTGGTFGVLSLVNRRVL